MRNKTVRHWPTKKWQLKESEWQQNKMDQKSAVSGQWILSSRPNVARIISFQRGFPVCHTKLWRSQLDFTHVDTFQDEAGSKSTGPSASWTFIIRSRQCRENMLILAGCLLCLFGERWVVLIMQCKTLFCTNPDFSHWWQTEQRFPKLTILPELLVN